MAILDVTITTFVLCAIIEPGMVQQETQREQEAQRDLSCLYFPTNEACTMVEYMLDRRFTVVAGCEQVDIHKLFPMPKPRPVNTAPAAIPNTAPAAIPEDE